MLERALADVAVALGVRRLADHGDRPRRTATGRRPRRSRENVTFVGAERVAQAAEDRRAVREVGVGVAGALPGEGPAAGLVLERCRRSCRPPAPSRTAASGSSALLVLEQHQRLAHRAPGQRAAPAAPSRRSACSRADGLGWSNRPARSFTRRMRVTASSIRAIGISPLLDLLDGVGDERLPVVGTITMSMPALIACGQLAFVQPGDLADAVPVGDDEAVEAHLALEDVGQRLRGCRAACPRRCPSSALVQLLNETITVWDAGGERAVVALAVDVDHLGLGGGVDALVLAARRCRRRR